MFSSNGLNSPSTFDPSFKSFFRLARITPLTMTGSIKAMEDTHPQTVIFIPAHPFIESDCAD